LKIEPKLQAMNYSLEGQETKRLTFRLLAESDFDRWMTLFLDKSVALYLGMDITLSAKELCRLWFDKIFHRYDNNLGVMNALVDKRSDLLIGQCGLLVQSIENEGRLEIGYSMLPDYWNRGFATEAAQKCRDYAFKNSLCESLISIVHVDNVGSKKVAVNNGMKFEKHLKNYKGAPMNIFSISKEEWNK
jgi:ribosomal-protein-alanine N-acetyltransferase